MQSETTNFIFDLLSNFGISTNNASLFLGWMIVLIFALKAFFAVFINYIIPSSERGYKIDEEGNESRVLTKGSIILAVGYNNL